MPRPRPGSETPTVGAESATRPVAEGRNSVWPGPPSTSIVPPDRKLLLSVINEPHGWHSHLGVSPSPAAPEVTPSHWVTRPSIWAVTVHPIGRIDSAERPTGRSAAGMHLVLRGIETAGEQQLQ